MCKKMQFSYTKFKKISLRWEGGKCKFMPFFTDMDHPLAQGIPQDWCVVCKSMNLHLLNGVNFNGYC